jgi:membrane protein YqaA with SNARE-associated domain
MRFLELVTSYALPFVQRIGDILGQFAYKMDGFGLMLIAIAESSFLSFPEANDILLVVLSTGKSIESAAYLTLMTIIGSVTGCLLLYTAGRKGGHPLLAKRFSAKNIAKAERLFERYGLFAVAVPSILPPPCPFKIFVLSAGVFRLNLTEFATAVIIGRTLRYSMWATLAVLYGDGVKIYMQQNLGKIGLFLSVVFLIILASLVFSYLRKPRLTAKTHSGSSDRGVATD